MPRGTGASRQGAAAAALRKHPYPDSALLHGVLGGLLFVIAWLTGDVSKAIVVGALCVVLATGWSWNRFRQRSLRKPEVAAVGEAGT